MTSRCPVANMLFAVDFAASQVYFGCFEIAVYAGHTFKDSVNNLAHNIPEPLSQVLHPITAALHPTTMAQAPAPAGADTEVHVDEVDPVSS